MPHWINLSFYSTNKKVAYSSFIPRIKLPPLRLPSEKDGDDSNKENQTHKFCVDSQQSEYIHNSLFDYDAYDAQIFSLPSIHGTWYAKKLLSSANIRICIWNYQSTKFLFFSVHCSGIRERRNHQFRILIFIVQHFHRMIWKRLRFPSKCSAAKDPNRTSIMVQKHSMNWYVLYYIATGSSHPLSHNNSVVSLK